MTKGLPEKHLYKNRLQEYTQKSGLPLPTYTSRNKGVPHAPKFWAQVEVNGIAYASMGQFTHVKEAEQDAARIALEHITNFINFALGLPEKHWYKNRLQEYTQKSGLPLPTYTSRNKGVPHAPKFWAQVEVNGIAYASTGQFTHVKEAEQDAARIALEHITQIVKNGGAHTIQDPIYCKSILNEYCAKINLKKPEYTTTFGDEKHPVFISSMVFNGETYRGEVAGSKKMAEQLAARAAIQSLLESGSEVIRQIISSKFKIHEPAFGFKDLGSDRSNLQIVVKSDALMETSKKTMAALPSTSEMKSECPHANSRRENKRKHLIENSSQQKKRVHKQKPKGPSGHAMHGSITAPEQFGIKPQSILRF